MTRTSWLAAWTGPARCRPGTVPRTSQTGPSATGTRSFGDDGGKGLVAAVYFYCGRAMVCAQVVVLLAIC